MPNWCDCDLTISGKEKDLKRFKKFAKEGKRILSNNKFIPYPQKFEDMSKIAKVRNKTRESLFKKVRESKNTEEEKSARDKEINEKYPYVKDGFNLGGYEWCIKNWGTKWDMSEVNLADETTEQLFYGYQTAWSPNCPVILKMSKLFPKLTFELRYFEGGMGFNGLFECEKGKVLKDEQGDYFGDRGG